MTTPQCRMTALPSTEDLARLAQAIPAGPWLSVQNHPTNACAHVLQDADWAIEIATLYGNHDDVPHPREGESWGDMPVRDATAEAIALLPALIREVLDRREADRWQPIETCPPGDGPVLIYYPDMESDAYYPGHPIHVSNREYVLCGNAAEYGASHWRPIPAPPTTEPSHGK